MHDHAGIQFIAFFNRVHLEEFNLVEAGFFGEFIHSLVEPRMQFRHAESAVCSADGVVGVNAN